jgi:Tol biopolymer transport system component
MGEVYRARDTRLQRDVALKVLPEAFARDMQRMARFEREAKLLASLNHPNIAAIYGLEESGPIRALVMELVEGPTLAERIRSGAIPLDEALPIARQVADAVEYAHDNSVIHRDLKPANIKVKEDGTVKVLDFGLAKAMSEDPTEGDMSNSPTLSMAATRQGVILGTAAYMSPEQAKGKIVDRRADVWAFGVVFYEMLAGRQLFTGDSVAETLASVMKEAPPFDLLPSGTPPAVRALLRRCLERNLRRRLAHIAEGRITIEDVLSGVVTAVPVVARRDMGRERWAWAMAAVAVAVVAALAVGLPAILRQREEPAIVPPEMRTEINTPSTIDPASLALSPDGRQIVFVASGDGPSRLWLRRLDTTVAQQLPGTEGAFSPFWSPDGRSVGFFADGQLKRMDVSGGPPQPLIGAFRWGGAWSQDGTILFTPTAQSPLFRISATGGEPAVVTELDRQSGHRFPHFLPGGQQFLFYATGNAEIAGIYLGSLDSPESRRLTAADTAGAYLPAGWLLFLRGGTLLAQQLDLGRGVLTGDPVTVADSVAFDPVSRSGAFSVSAAGLVAYRHGGTGQRQLTWFDRSGKTLGTLGPPDPSLYAVRLSPNGRRAAVFRTVQGNNDIWLLDGTRATRFTFDPGPDIFPVWSPNGDRIVFDSSRMGRRNLYVKPSNLAGNEELLLESEQDKLAEAWSRDGRFLLYQSLDPQTSYDIWVLPMEGDRKPFVFLKTSFDERRAHFSPDGRWVAYRSNESGRYEIYVRPFNPASSGSSSEAGPSGQWQVSTFGGMDPRWRADGRELYYIAPDSMLMAVPTSVGATFEPGMPVPLFQTRIFGGGTDPNFGTQYDVSSDDRFLIYTDLEAEAPPITLLQNWNPELR